MKSFFLYGNLTIDHNFFNGRKFYGPGGSVYFLSKTLKNLDERVFLFTTYGKDFRLNSLEGINIIPRVATKNNTLVFKNIYSRNFRRQFALNYTSAIIPPISSDIIEQITRSDAIIIAPLLNNLDEFEIKKIIKNKSRKLKVLLPQGFFRKTYSNKKIIMNSWNPDSIYLRQFNLVFYSDKDTLNPHKLATSWSRGGSIVVVTREALGCSIYQKGIRLDIPAFKINKINDSTGAGDVFAAAFCYHYLRSADIQKAAIFANGAAAISLRFLPDELKYGKKEIEQLINQPNK